MTDLFKEKARDWDTNDIVRSLSLAIGAAIRANVELNATMRVMDFGAGTGLITSQIADKVEKVTAVDVSRAMLDKLLAKDDLQGKVEALCQNILEQPLSIGFDLIVSAMAMHHVEDTDKLVACFAAHLKPGGKIALADLDEEDGTFHPADIEGVYHAGFNRAALAAVLSRHEFTDIRFMTAHTIAKDHKFYPVFLVLANRA
ncbi:class I SAM-dependent methyltransferase [Methylomonas methanica]|uniref:Methyltransferase type 12 n=1 Tax=Methylomonas methanica (strain DSM 25384 / MC09) TaxID=857087 RepID=G0A1L7_METMM|nr:methyltransferase domain-containing protein [Methylomonas methanica]AEG00078.1 Methyltransferase type 12 [Methylomonas methanica MC09]